MSWASFNVLEVMSSQKYPQKKVGYLAAIQSFRPDTEVLMLAENLLKKDLTSPTPIIIALPLTAIPHVINSSMANSLLSDLLPRLTHSQPAIRKKTIVTLYRLALVYPETLRPAWPKIKERLLDDDEDSSVTAAIVNVVCELSWRRPQDFLPLAPRLFDLLVQRENNWMAIKIIKLFATLTPLEPRLIKKLLPPLTTIIKTTPAMSLLYECINGIIQGGILEGAGGTTEGEEIARLCVGKLRSMLVVEGDPNLKYVALLAFDKIVKSHSHLVALHQDVILDCIDDADISIRMRALDLVVGMVNSDNLTTIVGKLMRQLRHAPIASAVDNPANDRSTANGVEPLADSEDEDPEEPLGPAETKYDQTPPLPEDYRIGVIRRILEMCSWETYVNITDFEWYIDVLVQLVRVCPALKATGKVGEDHIYSGGPLSSQSDISHEIGDELRNVAVRVKSVRAEAINAAQNLILLDRREQMFPAAGNGGQGVLEYSAWLVGEFSSYLNNPHGVLTSLVHPSTAQLPSNVLTIYVQAVPKVFVSLTGGQQYSWTRERKTSVSLLLARIVHFLEPLAVHPSLEVQERAVEFLDLMKLVSEAVSGQEPATTEDDYADPPLLLTQAIPSLFTGQELNPVAIGAQRKVPLPDDLDFDAPINENLHSLLQQAEHDIPAGADEDDMYYFYNQPPSAYVQPQTAADRLGSAPIEVTSYQQADEGYLDPDILAKRKAEKRERNRDDPFYIGTDHRSGTSTPIHNIIKNTNEELDVDSIPIMNLDLEGSDRALETRARTDTAKRKPRRHFEIMTDENIGSDDPISSRDSSRSDLVRPSQAKGKRSVLVVDSSGLGSLSLEDDRNSGKLDVELREAEAKALKEVERLRLEMQRASERILAKDVPEEGILVKRKKKKKPREVEVSESVEPGEVPVVKKKKKKPKESEGSTAADGETEVKPKKKNKKVREVGLEEGEAVGGS
ncbi:Adaptor protein complex AP-3 delta subunit [Patellaria atrata CBS 101060]|uniref:AP-3 complex subunit delta n=1 Tax=Patellaria atrata CBS 101060 TaxID=1346257 RepID=A0A9P4VUP9_9PEZI|nr:Adaptor protein complex AP-3 delta subunit [Patellaria atrata CBS 101060]